MPDKHCSKLLRVVSWGLFHFISTITGLCIPFKPQVILAPSPPLSIGLNAYVLAGLLRAKYIYNVQELYPDIAVNLGIIKNKRLITWLSSVERFIYNHAASVTTITDSIQAKVVARSKDKSLVRMIPNFVDFSEIIEIPRNNMFSQSHQIKDHFVVTYAGNLGVPQNLWLLVEVASQLKDVPKITFLIIGDGTEKEGLAKAILEKKLTNIHVIDYQPMSMMPSIYAASDVFYVGQIADAHSDGIPSKIYRIFGNKKPILAVTTDGSDLANCIRSAEAGVVVSDNRPKSVAAAVLSLKDSPVIINEYGLKGFTFSQNYTREKVCHEYDSLIRSVCERIGRGKTS
jgi:colanic acid biosynthesis glycosyl transferase WcaI